MLVYEKIYTPKPNTLLIPQTRAFQRFVKQMLAGILKDQDSEVIQRLQNLEYMIEKMTRVMARRVRRRQ